MDGKAYFFRNTENYLQLKEKTENAINLNFTKQPFVIIKSVCLPKDDFIFFKKNFIKSYSFIFEMSYKLKMNNSYEYICLLVYSKEFKIGYLVNSNDYSYPRNIAEFEIGECYGI